MAGLGLTELLFLPLQTTDMRLALRLMTRITILIQPYMDVVTLWFWHLEELLEYDKALELCQKKFPGKKVLQGIFLHEYGRYDGGNPPQLLIHQLNKVREYMAKGVVEGIIILGDREIKKWPESASAVKNYLLNQ